MANKISKLLIFDELKLLMDRHKHIFRLVFALAILSVTNVMGQHESHVAQDIVCYASNAVHRVRLEEEKLNPYSSQSRLEESNPFEVTYFNIGSAARNTIEHATEIWSRVIQSDLPIKISVTFSELGERTLGSARPGSYESNFEGAPKRNIAYPIALAERLARKELNDSSDYEIIINLNINFGWHYFYDQPITEDSYDLLTVVLHEIGHGLGLADTYSVSGNNGSWGTNSRPNIYDYFIYNYAGEQLIKDYKNFSNGLYRQLTSNRLVFNANLPIEANEDLPVRIYSPTEFNGGSSISHLDEDTFVPGDTNALMTPQVGREEVNHNTGPIVNGMLAEMGYIYAFIDHDSIPDQPDEFKDVIVKGKIQSDSSLIIEESYLIYSFDDFETVNKSNLTLSGEDFTATIPAPGFQNITSFYFEVKDVNNLVFRNPTEAAQEDYEFGYGLVTSIGDELPDEFPITLYPNPTNGLVHFSGLPENQFPVVYVRDSAGKEVYRGAVNSDASIDLGLKSGIYFVNMKSASLSYSSRLIIR